MVEMKNENETRIWRVCMVVQQRPMNVLKLEHMRKGGTNPTAMRTTRPPAQASIYRVVALDKLSTVYLVWVESVFTD